MSSVAVTAADRAAATCQRWVPHSLRGDRAKISKGRSQSPLVRALKGTKHLLVAAMPPPLASFHRREDHPQQWMVGVYTSPLQQSSFPAQGLILGQPLRLTASSAEGAFWHRFPQSLSLKGEAPAIGGRRGSFPQRRQVTNAPPLRRNHLCRSPQVKRQPLFGREGSGGRGASLREAASPPVSPTLPSLGEGARGRGASLQRSSPPS